MCDFVSFTLFHLRYLVFSVDVNLMCRWIFGAYVLLVVGFSRKSFLHILYIFFLYSSLLWKEHHHLNADEYQRYFGIAANEMRCDYLNLCFSLSFLGNVCICLFFFLLVFYDYLKCATFSLLFIVALYKTKFFSIFFSLSCLFFFHLFFFLFKFFRQCIIPSPTVYIRAPFIFAVFGCFIFYFVWFGFVFFSVLAIFQLNNIFNRFRT